MTGRNRILIGMAAIVLVGLGLLLFIAQFSLNAVPQISLTLDSTTAAVETSDTPMPQPKATRTASVAETAALLPTGAANISSVQATSTALAALLETPSGLEDMTLTSESIDSFTPRPTASDPAGGDAPTDMPTDAPTGTPPPTPIEIAFAPVLIRSNVSGDVIGDGTLRLYAPESVGLSQTVRVELELNVDNAYITPTPQGLDRTAVPRSTQVSSPPGTTPTPYVPVITDQGLPVYQRMGATLLCSQESFSGCDGQRDPTQTKLIASRSTSWSWILRPAEGASGGQDLRLEVWITQLNLDGQIEFLDVADAQYRFTIAVNPAGGISPILIALIVVAGGLVTVGTAVWRRRRGEKKLLSTAAKTPATATGPLVFISYRRGSSWGQARSIEQSLRKRGADVFIDIDDINEGKFAETIQKAIADCHFFLPVLAPGTLESMWVRREIAHAIQLKKTIVPLLVDGFVLEETLLPSEIVEIASHNAIRVLPEFYEEAMDRLAKRFLRLE